jgi:CheY-like chemotaxis protein
MPSVLVVDDEEYVCRVVRLVLEGAGYQVFQATSVEEGLRLLREHHPDALTVDLKMPGSTNPEFGGLDLLLAKERDKGIHDIPSLVLTAAGMQAELALERASAMGASSTLRKPFSQRQLIDAVERLLAQ